MRCSKARQYIDLSSSALDRVRSDKLEKHLKQCAVCREYQAQDLKLGAILSSGLQVEFPQWIHQRIMQQSREHDSRRIRIRHRARWQAVPTLAAIAISLYLGGLVGFKSFSSVSADSDSGTSISTSNSEYAIFGESSLVELVETDGE